MVLGVKPFPYQARLLEDQSKRIVSCWGRQTGKTTTIAMKAIYFAHTNPNVTVLITSPSLRQSMIMFDRIATFVYSTPYIGNRVVRATRTIIQFDNGSNIIALPCSENLLRGYTAHLIICLPPYAIVTLADGERVPISHIKEGQDVLSFNQSTQRVEPKKVLKIFRNPLNGKIIRVCHEFGYFDCTPEHKILTVNRGYTPAMFLTSRDKLLYIGKTNEFRYACRQRIKFSSGAISLWRTFGRLFSFKNNKDGGKKKKKQLLTYTALLKTSQLRSIQILNNEGFCQNITSNNDKQRLGERISKVLDSRVSSIHKGASNLLHGWKKSDISRMACKDNASLCFSNLVYGRWKPRLEFDNDHQHPFIHVRRESNSSEMVEGSLEHQCQGERGQKRKRLLYAFSRERQGQVHGINPSLHNPKHELQDTLKANDSYMLNMRAKVYSKEEHSFHVPRNREKTDMPKPKMQENSTLKTLLQSIAHTMQNLWKSFHSPHRESSYMQQKVQSFVPLATQTRIKSSLQTKEKIKEVYNLNVEGNHNYFANGILVGNCDESAFMPEEVITQILFPMLSTTDGYAVFLSTPWGKNHFFYKSFMNPAYSVHKVKSSDCPLIKPEFLEEMKANMTREAYLMEYEAEFVEALNSFLPQDLIRRCVDPSLEFIRSLEGEVPSAEYYAGADFGKLQDYSVVTVVKREGDLLKLVYLREFPLDTPYAEVIGYLVRANQKFNFRKALIDQTGVGEFVLEELKGQGVPAEGLTFTVKTKEEMLTCLKIAMEQGRLRMPYDRRLCQQINEQQYAYTKSGHLQFSHSEGSHDDQLWSLALSVYVSTMKREEPAKLVRAWAF